MIREVTGNKREYLHLLLLADEQENMIDQYLDRGTMFVLEEEGQANGECVVTDEGSGIVEIQNLAIAPNFQRRGYGKKLVSFVAERYKDEYDTLQIGTGDSPLTVLFYESCGLTVHHVISNYILEHYDQPIFEGGKQLKDKVYLRMSLKDKKSRIDELLEKPYWIIDILPSRVPKDSPEQYFAVEAYFLKEQLAAIKQKHINLVLKLNCYWDISVVLEDEERKNPPPAQLVEIMKERYVYFLIGGAMILSEPDDTHLTLFNPDEQLLSFAKALAIGEGLFVWKGAAE